MKCFCCGHRKGLFESFEKTSSSGESFELCSKCAVILYHMRDASKGRNPESFRRLEREVERRFHMAKPEKVFSDWYEEQHAIWETALKE